MKDKHKSPGRVFRGGSWRDDAHYCRSAIRAGYSADSRYGYLGFRLVMPKKGTKKMRTKKIEYLSDVEKEINKALIHLGSLQEEITLVRRNIEKIIHSCGMLTAVLAEEDHDER